MDVVMIDTAGRLHNREDLMRELDKIHHVIKRHDETAPHEILLVVDGTAGQNAIQQARVFSQGMELTGLVLTKLDGTAKGGSTISIRRELGMCATSALAKAWKTSNPFHQILCGCYLRQR